MTVPSRRDVLQAAAVLPLAALLPVASPPTDEQKHTIARQLTAATGGKVQIEFHPRATHYEVIDGEEIADPDSKGHQWQSLMFVGTVDDSEDNEVQPVWLWVDDRDGAVGDQFAGRLREISGELAAMANQLDSDREKILAVMSACGR
jgi:hypothetical protein